MLDLKISIFSQDIIKNFTGKSLLIPVFEKEFEKDRLFKKVNQILNNILLKKAKTIQFNGEKEDIFSIQGSTEKTIYENIFVFGLGKKKEFNFTQFQNILANVLRQVAKSKITSTSLQIDERFKTPVNRDGFELGKILSEALFLSQYQFNKYKSEQEKKKTVKINEFNIFISIPNFFLENFKKGIEFGKHLSYGIYFTRDLVNEPASEIHPETLVEKAFEIEKDSQGKIKVEILDEDECHRLGMEAFLAVGRGSEKKPKFIILHYCHPEQSKGSFANARKSLNKLRDSSIVSFPQDDSWRKICLIGKSITFDSGGLSLKPSEAMETMKIDMAGGAVVLGVFKILAHLDNIIETRHGVSLPEIYGILPACENMPSGKALRPGDIVKALNEKTIEILNTDAEGRLTLADALSYAEKYIKPNYIIDVATLTGAIMIALGEEITGLFGNDERFIEKIKKTALMEGEEIWPMPLHENYLKKTKSDVADLKNVTASRYGGAINAALFLSQFVNKRIKWVHLDIAGSAYNKDEPKGLIPKGATGWGVRTIIKFLISNF